jgi:hypothetical protein
MALSSRAATRGKNTLSAAALTVPDRRLPSLACPAVSSAVSLQSTCRAAS